MPFALHICGLSLSCISAILEDSSSRQTIALTSYPPPRRQAFNAIHIFHTIEQAAGRYFACLRSALSKYVLFHVPPPMLLALQRANGSFAATTKSSANIQHKKFVLLQLTAAIPNDERV